MSVPEIATPEALQPLPTPKTTSPRKRLVVRRVFGGLLLMSGLLGAAYTAHQLAPSKNGAAILAFNASRDYERTPFDELDAQQICQFQTQEQHGDQLILSYLDSHSTRFDELSYVYKVFMFAHIGEPRDYEEAAIHCFIDPERHLIKHYKTIFPERQSLMTRALSFFTGK